MRSDTLVSALAGASLVFASPAPVAAPAVTPAPIFSRQSGSSLELECNAHYNSMEARQPLNEDHESVMVWLFEALLLGSIEGSIASFCSAVFGDNSEIEMPFSIRSGLSTYRSAAASYASSVAPAVSSLVSKCPTSIGAEIGLLAVSDVDSCVTAYERHEAADALTNGEASLTTATIAAPSLTTWSVQETGASENDTNSKNNASASVAGESTPATSTSVAGGPRETGHLTVAAAAVIGVVGAIAAI